MTPTNASTIAIAERYAQEHFGLSLPISANELKSSFRRAAKELHTDTSGDDGTKDQFVEMKKAYDFLVGLEDVEFVYGERARNIGRLVTTDGTPLYELGLGLGPMRNGRDCERCSHKGYIEGRGFTSLGYCSKCGYSKSIIVDVPCHSCKGTGKFRQRRSGRVVTCRTCRGLGTKKRRCPCPTCSAEQQKRVYYHKCYECSGTGEIELFSPLVPKGRIINTVR